MKRIVLAVIGMAAVASIGALAQAGSAPASVKAPQTTALIKTVKVTSKEFKFVLSAKSAKRGVVIFKLTNAGALQHDFKIKGRKTKLVSHGKSTTLRISFLRKGHYPYVCTVPGHAAAGMTATLTVTK